jgi:hypothetical protein
MFGRVESYVVQRAQGQGNPFGKIFENTSFLTQTKGTEM